MAQSLWYRRDNPRLVAGNCCGSDPFGNISTIHVLISRYKGTASHPTTRVMFSLLPAFLIVTVLQIYNFPLSKIGTLVKNNSEEMLRVAGIEVGNDT